MVDSVSITPASPMTNDILTAHVTSHDIDGDALGFTYVWMLNGVVIDGETGSTLDLSIIGHGDKGDDITVTVTASDDDADSIAVTSDAVTIINSAPVVDSVSITPVSPTHNQILTAHVTSHDDDGDSVGYTYVWKINGNIIDGQAGSTLDLSEITHSKGDQISVEVTPNDGTIDGEMASATVTVANSAPVIDSVTITPASPATNDILTAHVTSHDDDDDSITYSYVWKVNGVVIEGQTGNTLDLSVVGDKGDEITVEVTTNDGTIDSAMASATVTVVNSAPEIDFVSITPSGPKTNEILTAHVTSHDIDGDSVTYSYVWKKNGVVIDGATSSTLDLSEVGAKGDEITVEITPNDGTVDGEMMASAAVTIINTPPVVDSVTIALTSPTTNQVLTALVSGHDDDGDSISYSYVWKKNGVVIDGETSSTLDLSIVGNGGKGDVITVEVTPNDGDEDGATVASDAVTVSNTAPAIDSVTITPASPTTNSILTAHITSHDDDGDSITYRYVWMINGDVIEGQTGSTLDLSVVGGKGDQITVAVTANDGDVDSLAVTSDAVTILNSAPVVDSVSITPASPATNDILTAHITSHDDDGDSISYSYVWKVNGVVIDGQTGSTLDLSVMGDKGDEITVEVTANDGTADSDPMSSDAVMVLNSAPVIDSVFNIPASPTTNDILTAHVTSHDADGDFVSYSYVWKVNGIVIEGQAGSSLDLAEFSGKGDVITVEVTPNDGTLDGDMMAAAGVTVVNSAPIIDSVSITPAGPKTNDILTANVSSHDDDGDSITYSYVWMMNGNVIAGQAGSTLDLSVVGAKGDEITVTVTANDGTTDSAPVASDARTILNSAPVVDSVSITPSGPKTNEILAAHVTSHDDDGDGVTHSYAWKINGVVIEGQTGSTLDLADFGDKGDEITVEVMVNDGTTDSEALSSTAVTVQNSAPVIDSVSITSAAPTRNETLTAHVTSHDGDGDVVTYSYIWKVNGVVVEGATGNTLDLTGIASKGDEITVEVTPNDGTVDGEMMASDSVTVVNSAPVIDSVMISPSTGNNLQPSSATTNQILHAIVTSHDDDGDAITYSYVWMKNGEVIEGETGDTLDLSILGNGDKGDRITVAVTANDGTVDSDQVTSDAIEVVNSAPVASNASGTVAHHSPTGVDVILTATDIDGDPLTYTLVGTNGGALHGTVTIDGNVAHFAPAGDYVGTDIFQFVANDGSDDSNAASVTITLTNSAPTVGVSLSPSNPHTNQTITATVTADDADDDAASFTYVWQVNGVTLKTTTTSDTTDTLDLSAEGNGDKGDLVTVSVTPNDGHVDGTAAIESATVTNTAPVAVDGSSSVGHTGTVGVDIVLSASDLDGDALTYSLVGDNGGALHGTVTITGNIAHYIPIGDYVGGDSFQWQANDGTDDSNVATVSMTLTNSAPTATVSLDTDSPATNDTLTATATASDLDGDVITLNYVWKVNGEIVQIVNDTTSLTDTLDLSQLGFGNKGDVITVEVTPNDGHVDGTIVDASATVVNTAPIADGQSISTDEDTTTTITLSGSDIDGDVLSFKITSLPANGKLYDGASTSGHLITAAEAAAGYVLSGNQVTFLPDQDYNGIDGFNFVANDGSTDSAPASVTITINPVNDAPVLGGVPTEVTISEEEAYSFTATATDVEGDTVSFSLIGAPEGATIDSESGEFSWTPTEAQGAGEYTFTVRVSDGTDATDQSITIHVTEVNIAPVLTGMPTEVTISEEQAYAFTAGASDHDNTNQTLTFSLIGTPTGATIDSQSGEFSWTPTEAQGAGDYTFTVEVSDGEASTGQTVTIHVTEVNVAPVLSGVPSEVTIPEEQPYAFTAGASDHDNTNQTLTFSLSGAPAGATIDPQTGEFSWTPTEAQGAGDYTFSVVVGDGQDSSSQSITIHVTEVNVAPVLTGVPTEVTIPEEQAYAFTTGASDHDNTNQELTFSLVGAPAGASIDSQSGEFAWTPSEAQGPGDYTFTVQVSDGIDVTEQSITIHVTEVNVAPELSSVPDEITIPAQQSYGFTAGATDADNTNQTLTFSLVGAPASASIGSQSGEFSWTPTNAQGGGDYTFTVRVSDGQAVTDQTITIHVTVAPPIVLSAGFDFNAPQPTLHFTFDRDIPSSLSAHGITVTTSPGGTPVAVMGYSYDSLTHTATFTLPASMADGNYHAALSGDSVMDASGISMQADYALDFFVLGGDSNHDGRVDIQDLFTTAKNYLQGGKNYTQGDFNYDGSVNLADLRILAANWGKTVNGGSLAPLMGPLMAMLGLPGPTPPQVTVVAPTAPTEPATVLSSNTTPTTQTPPATDAPPVTTSSNVVTSIQLPSTPESTTTGKKVTPAPLVIKHPAVHTTPHHKHHTSKKALHSMSSPHGRSSKHSHNKKDHVTHSTTKLAPPMPAGSPFSTGPKISSHKLIDLLGNS